MKARRRMVRRSTPSSDINRRTDICRSLGCTTYFPAACLDAKPRTSAGRDLQGTNLVNTIDILHLNLVSGRATRYEVVRSESGRPFGFGRGRFVVDRLVLSLQKTWLCSGEVHAVAGGPTNRSTDSTRIGLCEASCVDIKGGCSCT
jgi:hypothetical protein